MLIGRDVELTALRARVTSAAAGRGSAVCLQGEAGIGKTALLDAVAEDTLAAQPDVNVVRVTGIESELTLGHAALHDLVAPLLDLADEIPAGQRSALRAVLGHGSSDGGNRFLVAAAVLSLLSAGGQRHPLVVMVDDLQWIDDDTRSALTFAARRVDHDRVAMLLARRTGSDDAADLTGIDRMPLAGLEPGEVVRLLGGSVGTSVAGALAVRSGGNPLALLETAPVLTPEQRRGSAPLPDVLPVGERLTTAFAGAVRNLSPAARWLATLVAASLDPELDVLLRLLGDSNGSDSDRSDGGGRGRSDAVAEAERAGVLRHDGGRSGVVRFRHPLLRNAILAAVGPGELRRAHAALAGALADHPAERLRHRAAAATGSDDRLARSLLQLADSERERSGYASASALEERAAALFDHRDAALTALAAAVEDAAMSGDGVRVRRLAERITTQAPEASGQAHARALLCVGALEQMAGSVPDSLPLLSRAVEQGQGIVRIRALFELLNAHYRLSSSAGMLAAADAITAHADPGDPEQAMLVDYSRAAALAFSGDWAGAMAPAGRAAARLESEERLREDPRYLTATGLASTWAGHPELALSVADSRVAAARAAGALGVLPTVLSLVAGGMMMIGRHDAAYAYAGEAAELGTELGYAVDVATAHELVAWQLAARGRREAAQRALATARTLDERADVASGAVHLEFVRAFCALCAGDWPTVVTLLEARLAADEGRQPGGDHPFSVVPDLVEAYLAVGRRGDAEAVAARHAGRHTDTEDPEIRADALRIAALLSSSPAAADAAFQAAHEAYAVLLDPFPAARVRLLHGAALRRAGNRRAARDQLHLAATTFSELGFLAWADRTEHELAATGRTARRGVARDTALTSQETRVALFVAEGRTNKEIAAALFLSPKTVEHHVSSVLRKRGLRSRVEIATAFGSASGTGTGGSAPPR